MCRRDEVSSDARDLELQLAGYKESEQIAARVEVCGQILGPEEIERIRNRFELGGSAPEDLGRLIEHVASLERELHQLRNFRVDPKTGQY